MGSASPPKSAPKSGQGGQAAFDGILLGTFKLKPLVPFLEDPQRQHLVFEMESQMLTFCRKCQVSLAHTKGSTGGAIARGHRILPV